MVVDYPVIPSHARSRRSDAAGLLLGRREGVDLEQLHGTRRVREVYAGGVVLHAGGTRPDRSEQGAGRGCVRPTTRSRERRRRRCCFYSVGSRRKGNSQEPTVRPALICTRSEHIGFRCFTPKLLCELNQKSSNQSHPRLSYSVSEKDGSSNQSANPSMHIPRRRPPGGGSSVTRAWEDGPQREEVPTSKESLSCSNVGTAPPTGGAPQPEMHWNAFNFLLSIVRRRWPVKPLNSETECNLKDSLAVLRQACLACAQFFFSLSTGV